jgi:hypothetical protein
VCGARGRRFAAIRDGKLVALAALLPLRGQEQAPAQGEMSWVGDLAGDGIELLTSGAEATGAGAEIGQAAIEVGAGFVEGAGAAAEVVATGGSACADASCSGIDCGGIDCIPG